MTAEEHELARFRMLKQNARKPEPITLAKTKRILFSWHIYACVMMNLSKCLVFVGQSSR